MAPTVPLTFSWDPLIGTLSGGAGVEQREDVGMPEPGQVLALEQEPLGAQATTSGRMI
ncbi:MAG TPA: hypothetical protein VHL81_13885 [Gemmatimonadales bacterium]|jgi:hypothetical protein|nr:hypothetical protein [Gemmatimonadales bacterium]